MSDAISSAPAGEGMTPLKRAFLALDQAQSQLAAQEAALREPIAVVGLACRTPGAAGPAEFWSLMCNGVDAITEVPPDRWDHDALFDPDPDVPGRIATRCGGFLRDVDQFDPAFFGIAPREARSMDPQQRLMLEVSWEALENAGQNPNKLQGSAVGVYVGVTASDYAYLQLKSGDPSLLDGHFTSGIAHSIFSGRLSYLLGLQGPSLTIDTACSSSLVALHLACQALRAGDCSMALAGGVNLILAPDLFISLSRARMLAPGGRCRTFDAGAEGFARGEGCGMVVLKRQSVAEADGDTILALIRSTAVNQDGASSSLTAPNGPAQESVIRTALERAGAAPRDIGYLEAHGTGTQLGDPLEVRALGAVFARDERERPLILGSVKTNVGHLEAAAGVTSLIKVILSLRHRQIPAHLHFVTPSPHIPWADLPFQVPTALTPWEPIDGRRLAGISSFGFSGTNAHVIVEEAPERAVETDEALASEKAGVLTLSAQSPEALVAVAAGYLAALYDSPADLADIMRTANAGRAHHPHRAAIIASSLEQARAGLTAIIAGEDHPSVRTGYSPSREPPKIAFLCTGQGAQYLGMARGLYRTAPAFRHALDQCATVLDTVLDTPLLDLLWSEAEDEGRLHRTGYTQPALFAVEYALAALWRSWGVTPHVVMGHSVGEYVAACLAGVFSLEDGLRLIAERARLMQDLPAGGAMAACFAAEPTVCDAVRSRSAEVSIAAANGPMQTVISGSEAGIDAVTAALTAKGVRVQRLFVSHAFHSPMMEPLLDRFASIAEGVAYAPPNLRFISNLYGRAAGPAEVATGSYWTRHLRETVRFGDGLREISATRPDILIEIGPHPTLLAFAEAAFEGFSPKLIPSLRRERDDWMQMLSGLSSAYVAGVDIDWMAVSGGRGRVIDLPTYPFQRTRCWFEAGASPAPAPPPADRSANAHPLLGRRVRSATPGALFETLVGADAPGFIRDHRVLDRIIVPATAFLELAAAAASDVFGDEVLTLEAVSIGEAMRLEDDGARRVLQTHGSRVEDGVLTLEISSQAETAGEGESWVLHVSAQARRGRAAPAAALGDQPGAGLRSVEPSRFYAGMAARGLAFGPSFLTIQALAEGEGQAFGKVALGARAGEAAAYRLHPLLLDGALQVLAGAFGDSDSDSIYLPVGVGSFAIVASGAEVCLAQARLQPGEGDLRRADVSLFDLDGAPIADVRNVILQRVARDALARLDQRWLDESLYALAWRPAPLEEADAEPLDGEILVLAQEGPFASALSAELTRRRRRFTVAAPPDTDDADVEEAWRALVCDFDPHSRPLAAVIDALALHAQGIEAGSAGGMAAQEQGVLAAASLTKALLRASLEPRLLFVTRGGQAVGGEAEVLAPLQAPVWGFARSARLEHPEFRAVCVDLDPGGWQDLAALVDELDQSGCETAVAFRDGRRLVARLTRAPQLAATMPLPVEPWSLQPITPGSLSGFVRAPSSSPSPGPGEVLIAVEAVGLNFKDVLSVLQMYPGQAGGLGGECAGRVLSIGPGVEHLRVGDEVMAVAAGSFASSVVAQAELVRRRPDNVTVDEAASFPIAFITAEFCLNHKGCMQAGDRVLIHAAAGGVGMAAVQLAQRAGAEIFATAGAPWKRDLLREMGVQHVLDSRTAAFADEILAITKGEGVDLVLNSLAGDLVDASFRATARGGRFVEIGKRGIKTPEEVEALDRDLDYTIVDWSENARVEPAFVGEMMNRLVEDLAAGGLVPPPLRTFDVADVDGAFRLMALARHAGKVVVRTGLTDRAFLRPGASYLITGGFAGIGLSAAGLLAARGAERVVLVARRPPSEEALAAIEAMRAAGAEVVVEQADICDEEKIASLLRRLRRSGPPLRGVIHAAGVLDDAALLQQTPGRFRKALAPKLQGGLLLDKLTRLDPLDWFVLCASAAGVLGAPGQANHAAANAFLDVLAHDRRARGEPALSIDWGLWSDVGAAADRGLVERISHQGLKPLTSDQGLTALELAIRRSPAQIMIAPIDWPRLLEKAAAGDAFYSEIARSGGTAQGPRASVRAEAAAAFRVKLAAMAPHRGRALLLAFVQERASRALGLDGETSIDPGRPFSELGLDSLLAVELRNALSAALDQRLPATLLFDYPNADALTDYLMTGALGLGDERVSAPDVQSTAAANLIASVEELSDDQIDQMLAARATKQS